MAVDWIVRRLIGLACRGYFSHYFPSGGGAGGYNWPTPDADGPLVRPLTKLAELIATLPTFRTRCGLGIDEVNASEKLLNGDYGEKQRIFYPVARPEDFDVYPAALLFFGPQWGWSKEAAGAKNYLQPSGNLRLALVDKDNYPDDEAASTRDFGTYVGNFFEDLTGQFAVSDTFAGHTVTQTEAPRLCSEGEEVSRRHEGKPAYWLAAYLIEWE